MESEGGEPDTEVVTQDGGEQSEEREAVVEEEDWQIERDNRKEPFKDSQERVQDQDRKQEQGGSIENGFRNGTAQTAAFSVSTSSGWKKWKASVCGRQMRMLQRRWKEGAAALMEEGGDDGGTARNALHAELRTRADAAFDDNQVTLNHFKDEGERLVGHQVCTHRLQVVLSY